MIIVVSCFWLYFKVFCPWETCRLRSFSTRHPQAPKNNPVTFHRSAGAQRLRRPAWKSAIPLWFHDVPHGWRPEAFARQYASASDNRQNDTRPTQPDCLHLELARVSSALCHDPIISHRVRGMRNKNQFISLFLFLELSLASPTSPTTIGLIPPQFENRANMRRICHTLAVLLVCVGLLCTASGFIFDYLHPEYVSSFPSYLYLLRAVPFLIAAGVVETVFHLLKRRNKGRRNASNFPNRS